MKHYQSYIIAAVALTLASCADDKFQEMQTVAPARNAEYAYLNDYADLKSYVQHSTYPAFQLGGAVDGTKFNKREMDYSLAVANFEELVTGNTMKMGSIVNDKGIFDFTTTENFVNNATDAGLSVYGHTLCWHEQQPVKWLSSLIADKELDIDPNAKEWKEDYSIDYTKYSSFPFFNMGYAPEFSAEEGLISLSDAGWYQYFAADQMGLPEGKNYKITVTYKSPVNASVKCILRWNWGEGNYEGIISLPATDDWDEAEIEFNEPFGKGEGGGFIVFQLSGVQNQRICFKNLKVSHSEAPVVEIAVNDYEYSYKNDTKFPWYVMGYEPTIVNGCLHSENPGAWYQYFIADHIPHPVEGTYVATVRVKGSVEADLTLNMGWGWGSGEQAPGKLHVGPEWAEATVTYHDIPAKECNLVLQPGSYNGTIDIDWVKVDHIVKANSMPLTDEEKKDTLTWAMDKWIKGMMEACDGKVKAFDAINEPVDGWGAPVDGVLPLQHANPEKPDDTKFYWQDYLGDDEYVRTVIKLARQYGPEDIKLFINDYALEGYVVEGKYVYRPKLESLIKWIEKWESDGVTKIDGIGTQMHINCFEDDAENQKMMDGIAESFQKMAATGKFVRVSELDMGYIDASGNSVKTADMTEEGHKKMAKLYNFVVSKYLEIIPPAQQWGICAWGVTDQPTDSYWRPGEPTGLWEVRKVGDESGVYYRKHTYAGFATGLAGQEFEAGK